MSCQAVLTGQQFLSHALAHVDCQAAAIGRYGYGALADTGSSVSIALTGLLTIFVAVFGVRLLLRQQHGLPDVIGDALRVGIVLTLATSWPAWRIVGYNFFVHGPLEVAQSIGLAAQLPGSSGDYIMRLQRVDEGLAVLNDAGSGRLGAATGDWFQLGLARNAFLAGTLAPLAFQRLLTGILLALAPLMAGLLLFTSTRLLFAGWLKALVMMFLASIAISIVLTTELAFIEPWMVDVLQLRSAERQTLDAPVEIVVATISFALVSLGALAVCARIAFYSGFSGWITKVSEVRSEESSKAFDRPIAMSAVEFNSPARAGRVAHALNDSIFREQRLISRANVSSAATASTPTSALFQDQDRRSEILGDSFRRNRQRVTRAGRVRDGAR